MKIEYDVDTRLRFSRKFHTIYEYLIDRKIFEQRKDVFLFCAALGKKYNQRAEEKELKDPVTFHMISMGTNDSPDLLLFLSIYFASEGFEPSLFKHAHEAKCVIEQYAEAGMKIFINKFLTNYIQEANGGYILSIGKSVEIEKELLTFVAQELQLTVS